MQLVQRYLKDVGIEAEMKIQEYGAYMATTFLGKFEGMSMGPVSITWEPDSVLYGMYAPDQPRNSGHVNDPKLTAMLKEQRRTQDLEARKKLIFDIQRQANPRNPRDVYRRDVLKAGLAAGMTLSALPSLVLPCSGVPKRADPSAAVSCACAGGTRCTSIRIRRLASRRTPR